MRRATTPTHKFIFPDELKVDELDEILLTYGQCGDAKVLEKTLADLVVTKEDNSISYTLTQADTNKFTPGKAVVQARAKKNGTVLASQMLVFDVKPVLNEEEM